MKISETVLSLQFDSSATASEIRLGRQDLSMPNEMKVGTKIVP